MSEWIKWLLSGTVTGILIGIFIVRFTLNKRIAELEAMMTDLSKRIYELEKFGKGGVRF